MKSKDSGSTSKTSSWFPTREEVAARAHALWEQEGCPEKRDLHHWLRAEQELRAEHDRGGGGAGLTRDDVESDKRVDGLVERNRDGRSPKQERL